eukprot:scaffold297405_cov22-Tisochrysis_lutea.AAC.1
MDYTVALPGHSSWMLTGRAAPISCHTEWPYSRNVLQLGQIIATGLRCLPEHLLGHRDEFSLDVQDMGGQA